MEKQKSGGMQELALFRVCKAPNLRVHVPLLLPLELWCSLVFVMCGEKEKVPSSLVKHNSDLRYHSKITSNTQIFRHQSYFHSDNPIDGLKIRLGNLEF